MPCALIKRLSFHGLTALLVLCFCLVADSVAVAQTDGSPSLRQLRGTADATAADSDSPAPGRASVDAIAAIVNKDVITLRQLDQEVQTARVQMREQNIPEPDADTLRKQVLQRMILNTLELQEARAQEMEVDDAELERVLDMIAERNGVSRQQMRAELEATGFDWDTYVKDLRQDVLLDQLRQRVVESTIEISDAEVDAFMRSEGKSMSLLATQPEPQPAQQEEPLAESSQPAAASPANPTVAEAAQHTGGQVMIGLAHILVAVPESASSSEVASLQQKAQALHAEVSAGADFSGVAAASSDGPQALDGGDMGVRPLQGWPDLFIEAIQNKKLDDVTDVFRSGNGFHILKVSVLDDGGASQAASQPSAPPPERAAAPSGQSTQFSVATPQSTEVTQTHARHILIKPSQILSDEQAEQRLRQLRQRIEHGESFADLARRHSEDPSAPQGGDLGWLTPGETVPPFQRAMDALEPGQISQPVESQFGWHLIEVLERRTQDMKSEFERMQARQILFERRVMPTIEEWQSRLRGDAYIENRLDPEANRRKR